MVMNNVVLIFQMFTWGFAIFVATTIFLSENLVGNDLYQSIKDPFYLSGWKKPFKLVIFGSLFIHLILFIYGVPCIIVFIVVINIIIFFLPTRLDFEYRKLFKSLRINYFLLFISQMGFFWLVYFIYLYITDRTSLEKMTIIKKFLFKSEIQNITLFASIAVIFYLIWNLQNGIFFKSICAILYYKESKNKKRWRIYYTDPSKNKPMSIIRAKEIIKTKENYYKITNIKQLNNTVMIPFSSIIKIEEYTSPSEK